MARDWVKSSLNKIQADFQRSADTHLIKLDMLTFPDIDIYLKDESIHPSGSLKHRLARSLYLHALISGWIGPDTPVIESSSGSTAVSEAYFAKLLGLTFIAVMPKSTAKSKIKQIEFYGGQCHFVEHTHQIYEEAENLASALNGHYMDQFTFAERATDWRGNNNIASSIFSQMEKEKHPIPNWVVMSAGTGGTSATIGRYIRYKGVDTKLLVVDPDNSAFYPHFNKEKINTNAPGSRIEGIGRPRVEPSFIPSVIDEMQHVPDTTSIATMLMLEGVLGRKVGPSTGTNVYGALSKAIEMRANNQSGSIVTLLCDSGERYLDTYYNTDWVTQNIGDISMAQHALQALLGDV
ncbi:PLP-dependent cysteine synthase family protein [Glaciecola sp. XM2]|uniref:PLP-dependent cysteine synthase family protein n=1 Tax=Glaciecola sp. XM2 TaxID=1914931 RepID=UPI001BDE60E3|nr:PLP-dependent cysteine synthase family protein [Glaciecola sp. XM2]MBT1449910.1 PLP-dependent cysteine synthase family protein [Glaciecola sp. XM2]